MLHLSFASSWNKCTLGHQNQAPCYCFNITAIVTLFINTLSCKLTEWNSQSKPWKHKTSLQVAWELLSFLKKLPMKIYPTWLNQKCSWTFSHFFSHAFLSDVSVEVIAAGTVCLRKLVVFYGFDHRGNIWGYVNILLTKAYTTKF